MTSKTVPLITQGRILFYNTKFDEKSEKAETHSGWGTWDGLELVGNSEVKHAQVKWTLLNYLLLVSRDLAQVGGYVHSSFTP